MGFSQTTSNKTQLVAGAKTTPTPRSWMPPSSLCGLHGTLRDARFLPRSLVLPTASPFQTTVLSVDCLYITRCTATLAAEHWTFEQCLGHLHVNMKIWEKEWHRAHGSAHLALVHDDHIHRTLCALCEPRLNAISSTR